VLPFDDLSTGEEQDWFADGMHEALLTTLQKIEGLRVTSRTSSLRYRDTERWLGEIARELDPLQPEAYWLLAAIDAQQERFDEALEAFARYESLHEEPVHWFRGYLYALAGQDELALQDLAALEQRVERGESASSIDLAQIHLGLADYERTLEILESAPQPGVSFQPYLWPEYEKLLPDPRFQAVLAKFGLPRD
jgi:tetratricopeptide (TPR) repeat protein